MTCAPVSASCCSFAAANRDPDVFEPADDIRVDRDQNRHLAFGYGPHYCIGVHLARLELRVALEELLPRLADLRVEDEHVSYDTGVSRGPTALDVRFTPGPRRRLTQRRVAQASSSPERTPRTVSTVSRSAVAPGAPTYIERSRR